MAAQSSPSCSIVIADTGESSARLQATLDGEGQLLHADSFERARQLVDAGTTLVICGCHFDEGRMYDLLRWMRTQRSLDATPFLAVRVLEGGLDDTMYESVKIATRALGGSGFVDLHRWERRYGSEQAARRLAERVRALCTGAPVDDPD